jgi:hypothetical protein
MVFKYLAFISFIDYKFLSIDWQRWALIEMLSLRTWWLDSVQGNLASLPLVARRVVRASPRPAPPKQASNSQSAVSTVY